MPKEKKELKVFIASPSDVDFERSIVEEVIEDLNTTWGDFLGVEFDGVNWEKDAIPGLGDDAQDVINKLELIETSEIFIGIMWKRFGTPTQDAASGTEDEFNQAFDRWEEDNNSISIMFYFSNKPASPDEMDPEQLQKVNEFKNTLNATGLTWTYNNHEEFTKIIRRHLSKKLQEWIIQNPQNETEDV